MLYRFPGRTGVTTILLSKKSATTEDQQGQNSYYQSAFHILKDTKIKPRFLWLFANRHKAHYSLKMCSFEEVRFLAAIGQFFMFLRAILRRPEKWKIYAERTVDEAYMIGIGSLGIVSIMSVFIGAVITLQTAYNIDSPWIPLYTVGFTARQSIILEFSPTIICLILAGIVGSKISGEIGSMRVSQQIDALEIMGVNSAGYLVLPKVLGALLMFPFLIIISMFLGIFGGWLFGQMTGEVTSYEYIYGVQYWFDPFSVRYALYKTEVFSFLIVTIASFFGYYTSGGSVEVGQSSTRAVVVSSIFILLMNYLLTQWLLT